MEPKGCTRAKGRIVGVHGKREWSLTYRLFRQIRQWINPGTRRATLVIIVWGESEERRLMYRLDSTRLDSTQLPGWILARVDPT